MELQQRRSVFKAARQRLQFDVSQIHLMGSGWGFFAHVTEVTGQILPKNLSFRVKHLFPAGACRMELEDNWEIFHN